MAHEAGRRTDGSLEHEPPNGGDSGSHWDAASAWLRERARTFGPLVLLASLLSAAGVLVGQTVGLSVALERSRVFFQIVLAGAVMAVVRNEVGLRTYGLFAPVVIAFIMIGAGPVWGVVLFVNVLVVTLLSYRALQPLKLGTAPRVAVLLSVAGIATALAFVASDVGLLPPLANSAEVFFPTIISAWYADRAASDIEERGWAAPAKRLLGTLVAIVVAYVVVSTDALVDWFMTTPVAWGVTLLVVAYLGSRPTFRLAEFRRFDGHFDEDLGPASALATKVRLRLARVRRTLARLVGRDVDEPERSVGEVLAMKRRNQYIEEYNPPHLRPGADEKAHINRRLTGLGVDSPRTYAVVDESSDLDVARRVVGEHDEFVVKPSKGYGGEGIVVVSGRTGDTYDTSKGPMTERDLVDHVRRIVGGQYSGLESEGRAILEEKLTPAAFMRDLHGDGVADVRVIVFRGYPVMAMTRLPTEESDGAANLHLGAVGVGLNVADGTPLGAFQQSRDRELDAHPDTGASLTDFRLPNWDEAVETAVEAAAASGLGYTGVDVVLTEGNVPKVLEVNVRPGLGIQNTTGNGLFRRLSFVEALPAEYEYLPAERKIELAKAWDAAGYASEALPDADSLREQGDQAEATEAAEATETVETAGTAGGDESTPSGTTEPTAVREPVASTAATEPTEQPTDATNADRAGVDDEECSADVAVERRDSESGLRGRLPTVGGGLTSGVLLAGALLAGFPVFTVLFVLVAVGFVGGLCCEAFGLGGVLGGERE
jgi:alpha-L-glutamate ligase-like protein